MCSEEIIPNFGPLVKGKKEREPPAVPFRFRLLSAEGHAIGALLHGGIALVGAHQDLVQRAVVLALAVMGALAHGALHTFVGVTVHILFPPFSVFAISMNENRRSIQSETNQYLGTADETGRTGCERQHDQNSSVRSSRKSIRLQWNIPLSS